MSARRTTKSQPTQEVLEDRRVLAASVTASLLNPGWLYVEGTEGNDQIVIRQDHNSLSVNNRFFLNASQVRAISVFGLGGHDTINLSSEWYGGQPIRAVTLI